MTFHDSRVGAGATSAGRLFQSVMVFGEDGVILSVISFAGRLREWLGKTMSFCVTDLLLGGTCCLRR